MHMSLAQKAVFYQQLHHLCPQFHTTIRDWCGHNDSVNGICSVDLITHEPGSKELCRSNFEAGLFRTQEKASPQI